MNLDFDFFFDSIMMGVGLAMDAFSVSLVCGLNEPCMKKRRMCGIAGIFALFQAVMPMIGWVCVHTIVQYFESFETLIPWIAFGLLSFIGGKMLYEGIKNKEEDPCAGPPIGFGGLLVQGVATSIDALSEGFMIENYNFLEAFLAVIIIAIVTFIICMGGVFIGKKAGTKLAGKAGVLGGAILIFMGLRALITSFLK